VFKLKITLLCTFLLAVTGAYSQRPGGRLGSFGQGSFGGQNGGNVNPTGQNSNTTDPNPKPKKGKILDDSTKQIYGPKTVHFFTEENLLNNRFITYSIDTLKDHFHKISFLQRQDRKYQDLGNWGTGTRYLFFEPNHTVGASLGYDSFRLYSKSPSNINYYNTKSPYTNMEFLVGGRGENLVAFTFNRNVNARWNVGTQLQAFNSKRQYGSLSGAGSQAVRNWNALLHTSYFSKDSSYIILGNASYTTHQNTDEGGVKITPAVSGGLASEDPYLSSASSNEKKRLLHLYQQLKQSNGLQLYHIFDFNNQANRYEDRNLSQGIEENIYTKTLGTDTTYNKISNEEYLFRRYILVQNTIGIKGFKNGFNYRLHLRRKDFSLKDSLDKVYVPRTYMRRSETIVGSWVNYYFKDSTRAYAQFEYLLGGDYSLQAVWQRKRITLGFSQSSIRPTLVQERFYSSIGQWNNNFNNTFTNSFKATLPFKYKKHKLSANGQYHIINNYIYFNETYSPTQHNGLLSFLQIGLKEDYQSKKWILSNEILLSQHTGEKLLAYPQVFVNSRVSYAFTYAKVLPILAGMDFHYRSAYQAMDYQAAIQQFYLQKSTTVKGVLLADAFVTTNLNRVRLTVKYSHLNQLVLGNYFVGAKHKGLKGGIGFGVNWPLFD
jgi:hypothetical protein